MDPLTGDLWAKQDQHVGDRQRLFEAVAGVVDASDVLYPGSFVDIAPSFVFPSVTYVDADRRAARFFADRVGSAPTGLADGTFDLLVSLYAGFISEHCTGYLREGGTLLVNPSHGDAAMASIYPRYTLSGVVSTGSGTYSVSRENLETYLVPKTDDVISAEYLHERGRGVAYTRAPYAYLFERTE